jgi:hypothetical protein
MHIHMLNVSFVSKREAECDPSVSTGCTGALKSELPQWVLARTLCQNYLGRLLNTPVYPTLFSQARDYSPQGI